MNPEGKKNCLGPLKKSWKYIFVKGSTPVLKEIFI